MRSSNLRDSLTIQSYGGYKRLCDALEPLLPQLEFLELPGGYWVTPFVYKNLLPELRVDLRSYTQLRTISMPIKAWNYVLAPNGVRTVRLFEVHTEVYPDIATLSQQGCDLELCFGKECKDDKEGKERYDRDLRARGINAIAPRWRR